MPEPLKREEILNRYCNRLSNTMIEAIVGIYDPSDPRGWDGDMLLDLCGKGNHMDLVNAPTIGGLAGLSGVGITVDGVNEYFRQHIYNIDDDPQFTSPYFKASAVAGNAFIQIDGVNAPELETLGGENITNGNNESAKMSWDSDGINDAATSQSAEQAHGGSNSTKVLLSDAAGKSYYRDTANTSGELWKFTGWVYLPIGQTMDTIRIQANDGVNYGTAHDKTSTDAWVAFEIYVLAESTVELHFTGLNGVATEYFYIDDFSAKQVINAGLSQFATATKDYTVIAKTATASAHGRIEQVQTGEALGAELIAAADDRTFTVWGNVNWTARSGATIADGTGKAEYTLDATGLSILELTGGYIDAITVGKAYVFSFNLWQGTSSAVAWQLYDGYSGLLDSGSFDNTEATVHEACFTALNAAMIPELRVTDSDGGIVYLDDCSLKEVTEGAATAVTIHDKDGAQNWASTNSIDWNAITSVQVVRSDFHDISAAMTVSMWVKPDDGQPAGSEELFAQWVSSNGYRKVAVYLETNGKLAFVSSVDGSATLSESTNAAVFSNGAVTVFTHIAWVYDGSGPSATCYVNSVAVENAGGGSAAATLYDGPALFVIGALSTPGNYFAGDIGGAIIIFSAAAIAAEIQHLYLVDLPRLSQ